MKYAVVLAAFATSVLASGADIIKALNQIDNAAIKLNASLNTFTDIPSALPVLADSLALQSAIDTGTNTANASALLTVDESVALLDPTNKLVADTKSVLNNFVAKKPVFDANLISFIAVKQLQDTQGKANNFSAAVIAKVPDSLKPTAQQIISALNPAFQAAIDAYNIPFSLPNIGGDAPVNLALPTGLPFKA